MMAVYMPEETNHVHTISWKSITRIIVAGLLLVAAYYLRDMLLVLAAAIVLSSFIETFVEKCAKFRINRTFSVVIFFALSFFILAAIFYLFVPVFVSELSSLGPTLAEYLPSSEAIKSLETATSNAHGLFSSFFSGSALSDLENSIKLLVSNSSGGFFQALYFTFGGLTNLIMVVIISFLLSVQPKGVQEFLRLVMPLSKEEYAISLWSRAERKIGLWFQGQLLLGLIVGVLCFLGLSIFGVKYALVLALLTAVLELIPFGMVLATIPAMFFSYIDGGLTLSLIVGGFYIIVHQFESYLIAPLIVKKVVGISPLAVILSLLIGLTLAGFWGVILAIPVAVVVLEYVRDIEKEKAFAKSSK